MKEKRSIRITQDMREECIEFLRGIGFVCLTIENHEAEALCASLAKEGRSNATVTEGNRLLHDQNESLIDNYRYGYSCIW